MKPIARQIEEFDCKGSLRGLGVPAKLGGNGFCAPFRGAHSQGFTLIELLVVVLIIGVLAAVGVPQYFKVVEKSKTVEAMSYMGALKSAQERCLAKYGQYCASTAEMDITLPSLTYFKPPTFTINGSPGWDMTLERQAVGGKLPAIYGAYHLIITVPPGSITCGAGEPDCTKDFL